MYWSIQRELWENRSIYLAPLAVAAFVLLGSFIAIVGLPRRIQKLPPNDPVKQHSVIVTPFSMAPAPIMFTTLIVGIFYSLDALHGERRDRSILFWKSLPVSDRTTVLSKASIPLLVLPLISLVLGIFMQWLLMLLGTAIFSANGISPAALWREFRVFQEPVIMIYGIAVHILWFAPIYSWLLLISAWARRTPILWATLPPLAVGVLEKMAFNTTDFAHMLQYRAIGAMTEAFAGGQKHEIIDELGQLTPGRFLSAPGLWIGLIAAAAFLAVAIRLRRRREPN